MCLCVVAFLIGIGTTILLLAKLGKKSDYDGELVDRVEGCLTFVFGMLPTLLGFLFLLNAVFGFE